MWVNKLRLLLMSVAIGIGILNSVQSANYQALHEPAQNWSNSYEGKLHHDNSSLIRTVLDTIKKMKLDGSYSRAMMCSDKAYEIVEARYITMSHVYGISWYFNGHTGKSFEVDKNKKIYTLSNDSDKEKFFNILISECRLDSRSFKDPNDTFKLDVFLNNFSYLGFVGFLSESNGTSSKLGLRLETLYNTHRLNALSQFQKLSVPEQEERVRIAREKDPANYRPEESGCCAIS